MNCVDSRAWHTSAVAKDVLVLFDLLNTAEIIRCEILDGTWTIPEAQLVD
jgi:hypothetical protein